MHDQFSKIAILLTFLLLLSRCAQVVPLSGGKRDTVPPKLLQAVPENASVNFSVTQIVLKFNEFVQLKDLTNQLIISPGFKTDPEIEASGKKVVISLKKEELLPNTTYRIFFGKALADMTEGNPLENFEYIFSTGAVTDTLRVKGTVTEMFDEKKADNALVGLYITGNIQTDSFAYKTKPEYITRTNSSGEFSFSHLPEKDFRVVAFTDKNKNYVYDGEAEKIAFSPEILKLTADTGLRLFMFREEASKLFIRKSFAPYYGKAMVIYNKKGVFEVNSPETDPASIFETRKGEEKDTIAIYYKNIPDTLRLNIRNAAHKQTDTLQLALPKSKPSKSKSLTYVSNIHNGVLSTGASLSFVFYNFIDTVKSDISRMRLLYTRDTAMVREPLKVKWTAPFSMQVVNPLREETAYRIVSDSASIFDVNGRYNDSMDLAFKLQGRSELGKVTLKLLLNKKQQYIVQLINDQGTAVKEHFVRFSLSSSNAASIDFTDVAPGTYRVKVLFDDNENKKWDTGNFLLKRQPENVFISSKQIKVMPDWDVEEEIQIK